MPRQTKAQKMEHIRARLQIMAMVVGGINLSTNTRQEIAEGLQDIYQELRDWS